MRYVLLITSLNLLSLTLLPAQDLRFVAEECSDECPDYGVLDVYEIFKDELFQAFVDSESGTITAHEEGGWIIQTREKQEDGCYRYCTQLYRVPSGQECFYATDSDDPAWCSLSLGNKPEEDEHTRVVASFHTHPIILVDIKDILDVEDSTELEDGNMEYNGYDFPGIEYDHPDFDYLAKPSEGDKIVSVYDEVPGIILASDGSNEAIPDGTAYGFQEFEKDENGKIIGVQGDLVLEPLNLSWECEACVEISPIEECLDIDKTITLQATVKGPEDKSVNWEAQEGSIDDNGKYQAPSAFAGIDMVIATSVADETAKDTLLVQVGCDCEWEATLTGDISGKYEGRIAAYQDSEDQLQMLFFTGPTENDYPRLGLTGLPMPSEPGTFVPYAFSITLGPDDPVMTGGSELGSLGFVVQLIIENIGQGVIEGRIVGTLGGTTTDDIVRSEIDMTFRALLYIEGEPYPCIY